MDKKDKHQDNDIKNKGDDKMEMVVKDTKKLKYMMNELSKNLPIHDGDGDKIRLDINDDSDKEWFNED